MNDMLIDTSIFIGLENGRLGQNKFPPLSSVSVVTVGELRLGVLSASTLEARARRLRTLSLAESFEPLPIDDTVAQAWAVLRAKLHAAGKKAFTNDSWIAATAIARGIPVATQDGDYDEMPGVRVIRI